MGEVALHSFSLLWYSAGYLQHDFSLSSASKKDSMSNVITSPLTVLLMLFIRALGICGGKVLARRPLVCKGDLWVKRCFKMCACWGGV